MEQELFEGLHKNRRWALEAVCQENLCRSWYLSYQLAGDAAGAASLLLSAWREALAALKNAKEAPGEDFQGLLSEKILAQYQQGVQPDTRFENLPPPKGGEELPVSGGGGEAAFPPPCAPCIGCMPTAAWDASQLAAVTGGGQRRGLGSAPLPRGRSSWPSAAPPWDQAPAGGLCAPFHPVPGPGRLWLPRGTVARVFAACPLEGAGPACQAPQGAAQPGPPSASRFWALPWGWPPWQWRQPVLAFVLLL